MKQFRMYFLLFVVLMFSCKENVKTTAQKESETVFIKYSSSNPEIATGFRIKENGTVRLLEILNPRDSSIVMQKFYLLDQEDKHSKFDDGKIIRVPINSMVCLSASHLSFLDALGEIDKLVGVSSADYVVSKEFMGKVESGEIKEIGIGDHFKLEELINISPDLVMVSPQKGQSFQALENAGITILPNGDFLESHPLGRAEWIKFMGVLTGKETEARQLFDIIKKEYEELKSLTQKMSDRPTVLSGKQYGGFWNLSGGNSYVATFLEDAGADYLWEENEDTGGIMLDFETVYDRGLNADFWRFIVYSANDFSYSMLLDEDERYGDFSSFKNKQVIFCNSLKKPFFQKGILEPQLILADYIFIFHPELIPDHESVYYSLLK